MISLSTKPKKRWYSYADDGHICEITCNTPSDKGGGYFYCYFRCDPYQKLDDGTYVRLYEGVNSKYEMVTSFSYNVGNTYYYYTTNEKGETSINTKTDSVYYSRNGQYQYTMPNSALELPLIKEENEDKTTTIYYLDTFIDTGDTYKKVTGDTYGFTAHNRNGETYTYGKLLQEEIEGSVSIYNFTTTVDSIPNILKSDNKSIDYTAPDLTLYGETFMKLLTDEMIEAGEAITSKYVNNTINFTTNVGSGNATITIQK